MNGLNKKIWKNLDVFTLIILLLLFLTGVAFIINATAGNFTGDEQGLSDIISKLDFQYARLQLIWFILGLGVIFVICLIDYHTIADLVKIPYVIFVALLGILLIVGETTKGIAGWFKLGERGFQPAEFMKIILIIIVAKYAAGAVEKRGRTTVFDVEFWKMALLVGIPFLLVVAQPDAGTAMIYMIITFGILFASGFSLRTFLLLIPIGLILIVIYFFTFMEDYQKARIINFANLWDNETFLQIARISLEDKESLLARFSTLQAEGAAQAVRAGGMFGKGFFNPGSLTRLEYLPEAHTDFIFASGIEAAGFLGGLGVILLYALLLGRSLYLAYKAKDKLGTYIIVGVVSMELIHIIINIGMNIGVMPIMGLPLPFVSYGGSNMITNMMAMGLVLNVGMRRPTKRYGG